MAKSAARISRLMTVCALFAAWMTVGVNSTSAKGASKSALSSGSGAFGSGSFFKDDAGALGSGLPGLFTVGQGGWLVQSSANATQTGDQISTPGFSTSGWLSVKPDDAGAPGTEIEAILQNVPQAESDGLVQPGCATSPDGTSTNVSASNVFFSDNMRKCFGQETKIGPDTIPQFAVPWWFRTDFTPNLKTGQDARLVINGIVGQADLWINGTEVASQARLEGDYSSYTFDITHLIQSGTNSLALELYPNNPRNMFTLDTVDWSQIPPDNNTGIQFPVQLHVSQALGIGNAHVLQNDAPGMSSAAMTVKADVTNNTSTSQSSTVAATIVPPLGAGLPIVVTQAVTVPANTTQTVSFTPSAYPRLTIQHPQLWWPYQMGGQPLYTLATAVVQNGVPSDYTLPLQFGIRSITTYLTAPSAMAPNGVRIFEVNGVPFLYRGGGWSEDLFLHYSAQDLTNQIVLIKSMGLNGIRTEGKEMPQDFYDQMDRAGIMIDSGFQCCDKWQPSSSGNGVSVEDYHIMYLSSLTIGERLRDHPSVMNYSWSDNAPTKEQEIVSLRGFAQAGFQDPIISSAEYKTSALLGASGEKEGPYDWVPPAYWYDSTHTSANAADNDSSLTNVGGSWGFDSEQSAGDTVPTLDSLQRFMSSSDLSALWQNPDAQQYHTNYESTNGQHTGYSFGTLANLDNAIQQRYGQWNSLNQYVEEAQVQNYEDTRAQFEAFIDHWNNYPTPSTGTIYWQMNKGWPTLLWDLYNNDYDEAGSYFGAKKANESLHVLYAYDNGTVTVDNLSGVAQSDLSVESRVYDLSGKVLDDQTANNLSLASQQVSNAVITPRVPATTTPPTPAQTYFVELLLKRRGTVVDRNVYALSTQQDAVDWTDTQGNPQALTSRSTAGLPQYANLQALQSLAQTTVAAVASTRRQAGPGGADTETDVTITNTSKSSPVAFFLRTDVRRGNPDGTEQSGDSQILPITWSDNDITLWPGQSETLSATYRSSLLNGAAPVVSIYGWNVPRFDVAAPATPAALAAQQAATHQHGIEYLGNAAGTPAVSGSATPGTGAITPPTASGPHWAITSTATSPTTTPSTSFTEGDTADTYTLTATNTSSTATDGSTPVKLTDVIGPGLTLESISGSGWSCDTSNDPTEVCTETGGAGGGPDVLGPGQSYPAVTVTVKVSPTAGYGTQSMTTGLHVTNAVSVSGGFASNPITSIAPATPIVGRPDLTATNSLATAFRQGDAEDAYQIVVINQGAGATSGNENDPMVVSASVPAGETAEALYGSGWTCNLQAITTPYSLPADSCYRTDPLQGENGEEPPITLLVGVNSSAPASVIQRVTVSGGGDAVAPATVSAATTILPAPAPSSGPPAINPAPALSVTGTHPGTFGQGDSADTYTLQVSNASSGGATQGAVTVTDTLPYGLSAVEMSGNGWTCSLQAPTLPGTPNLFEPLDTCSRSDLLAPGASYPPITLTVEAADDARPSVTNTVSVAGGGMAAAASSTDVTAINQEPDLAVTSMQSAGGVPYAPFRQSDQSAQQDTYTVTASNSGFAATSGPMTVSFDLPAGLSAISLSGGDWTCSVSAATCTSNGGVTLAPGAESFITLQVAVARNVPQDVIPAVQISGGGEIDQSNDYFLDPTFITPLYNGPMADRKAQAEAYSSKGRRLGTGGP